MFVLKPQVFVESGVFHIATRKIVGTYKLNLLKRIELLFYERCRSFLNN